jgi:predicted DsbA family dithiol-disulfide isomerase
MNDVLETDARQTGVLVVEMVSDLICPWCFVAKRRVEKAAALLGKKVEVHWLPFELNADMPVDGLDRRVYRSTKFGSWEQSQRLDAQVAAAGAEVGIPFHHDLMKRTPNTLSRSCAACGSPETGVGDPGQGRGAAVPSLLRQW